jgi:ABC-type nickel/cobalt efflux system permease component RcnA
MSECRLRVGLLLCLLGTALVRPPAAYAHPVPTGAHQRVVEVWLRPSELAVQYRLEVDQFTTVYTDSKGLIDVTELNQLKTPSAFYEAYIRRLGPVLADQIVATLDGKPLTLRCVEQRFEVLDHLRCDFIFQADWTPAPGIEHDLEFHDPTYDREPGRVKLSLSEDAAVSIVRRTVPSSLLQSRAPTDLRPGDDDRLRTIRATFRLAEATAPAAAAPKATPTPAPPPAAGNAHSTLLALLDAPHGFGVLLLLAAAFGAAHALTPGHGKTLVAAYLVGERGTVWHAIVLGLTTTLTHTGAVLVLAAGLLWWFPDAVPAKVQTALGFAGGLLIAGLGAWLLLRRLAGSADHVHLGGAGHVHNPDGSVTILDNRDAGWGRLILLGVSGGIVPCWDAIAMLGFAIAAQRLRLGLPLLLAFSAGLAGVLVAIGVAVVYAKGRVGARWSESRLWRVLPIVSAAVLVVLGLWLCRDSLTPPTVG